MRTKRALLSYISDLIPQLLIAVIGLAKSYFFVDKLGAELNGLYSVYVQIMAYLTLMDGGLSSAILYRLYKPIADGDEDKLSRILSGSKVIFNVIGIAIFVIGTLVSFVFPLLYHEYDFSYFFMQATFFLYLISSVVSYFVVVQKTIFEAYQRRYITNIVTQSFLILKAIGEVVLINAGFGLFELISLLIFTNLATALIIHMLTKKQYGNLNLKNPVKDYSILKDVSHLLMFKIGSLIAYNIDVFIISLQGVYGLVWVTIYQQYNYIVDNLTNIVSKFTYSSISGVGDLISHNKERAYGVFNEFNSLCFFLVSIICIPLLFVINPFIQLWHEGRIETTELLALAFILNLAYYIIHMPIQTYVNSAGLFKETKICPILEACINLVLSLIFVKSIGIPGVLFATFIAYIISGYLLKPRIVYSHIFTESVRKYYVKNFIYLAVIATLAIIWSFGVKYLAMDGFFSWFISSAVIFIVNSILTYFIFHMLKIDDFTPRLKQMLSAVFNKMSRAS